MTWKSMTMSAVAAVATAVALHAQQPPQPAGGAAQDPVAALKQSIQQGLAKAHGYQWIETTIVSLKGEEKSRKQKQCYYGADGKVQKVPIDTGQPAQQAQDSGGGRRRGRIKQEVIEKKTDEMTDYMQQAAQLVHSYVPPDPARIQAAKDGGRISINPQAGGNARLVISQYLLPGDSMTIDMNPATASLLGLGVNTYLQDPSDAVTLAVQMATLPDGALYAAQTTLDAKAKNVTVVVQNSGYRPLQ